MSKPSHKHISADWIEAEFAVLRYFALNETDHRNYAAQAGAIAGSLRWRNVRAEP